jgi:hypothetical protein
LSFSFYLDTNLKLMTVITENSRQDYSWLSGNARLIDLSGQLLGAHIGVCLAEGKFWSPRAFLSETVPLTVIRN